MHATEAGRAKPVDLAHSVWQLTEEYPELVEILSTLGFLGVRSTLLRATLGKKMTIPEGCKRQGKDLDDVVRTLSECGFTVVTGA